MTTTYTPPIDDIKFTLTRALNLPEDRIDADLLDAVLEGAGALAAEVLAPLNEIGDRQGNKLENGEVKTAAGFKEAYTQYQEAGWNSLPFDEQWGGQNLPWSIAFPIQEMWQSANLSFGLCPLLNQGAVEALTHHADEQLQNLYLPKLISGEWTGTMNLTEPQAGSDLGALNTKATPAEDGTYRIKGQKIFITYGEHDFTPNIIHLVLARLPDAPEGAKGISLFVVPKYLVNADGSLGDRNDVVCTGLEHKLGIHASPTCTMSYGDKDGAIGYLVGKPHEGLKAMFTMMNNARLSVGLQGVSIAERATQAALAYAADRVQGKSLRGTPGPINHHPDVRRMLLDMQAKTLAARTLTYLAATHINDAATGDANARAYVEVLTPIVKSWGTDIAQDVVSTCVQVHGGMGFIEETGVAQFFRDARILPIYEGTNGIQANDLLFRKVMKDNGDALQILVKDLEKDLETLRGLTGDDVALIWNSLALATDALKMATGQLLSQAQDPKNSEDVAAVAMPYLNVLGVTFGGWMLAKRVIAAQDMLAHGENPQFAEKQILLARFYAEHVLPKAGAYTSPVLTGGRTVSTAPEHLFNPAA